MRNELDVPLAYSSPQNPVIITCAITGHRTTRAMAPVPFTPEEQAIEAEGAVAAGASVIHLHVREDDGGECFRVDRYEAAIKAILARVPDVIIEISTRGTNAVGVDTGHTLALTPKMWGARAELKPELCSLNPGSLNLGDAIFCNSPPDVAAQAARIYENGLMPECDIFDVGQLESVLELVRRGVLHLPMRLLFVLGSQGGVSASPRNLLHMVEMVPAGVSWTVLGTGRFNFPTAAIGIALGGHVRTGFEDTTYIAPGVKAKSNAELVARLARMAEDYGRPVATPEQAREIIGLKRRANGQSFAPMKYVA